MIFSFRYRDGVRGVLTRHVDAENIKEAEQIAMAWVQRKPGAFYIASSTEQWLVTLEDLPKVIDEPPPAVVNPKPSQDEQKERLKTQGAARKAGTGPGSDVKQNERVGA